MSLNNFFDELDQLISMLKMFSEGGVPIIVEGFKDERSLRTLGISGPILKLSGKNLVEVAEKIAHLENFLILTDFDRRGRELNSRLFRYLDYRKVDLTQSFRRRFKTLTSRITCDIEGLASSYFTLQNQTRKNTIINR